MREDWISDRFSNCFKLKSGDNLTKKNMQDGPYPVYGGNGIAGYHSEFNLDGLNLLIGRVGALCGNARFVNEKIWLTDNAFRIEDTYYDFDYKFLEYLLNFLNLKGYARQTAQPVISNSSLKNVKIKFPKSLPEQKRIVAILDEALEAIDQAKANIERNIENAEELFQSKLNEIFSKRGNGWEERKIKDISGTASNIKWEDEGGERKYIDLSSVSRDSLSITETEIIDKSNAPSRAKKIVKKDDVLFGTTRPTLKRVTIIDEEYIDQICSTGFYVIRPKRKIITPEWIFLFLQTKGFMDRMGKIQSGASYPAVNYSDMKNSIIRFPISLEEQQRYSSQLFELQNEKVVLINSYKSKIEALEELKKSILQKAFSGELTANEQVAA